MKGKYLSIIALAAFVMIMVFNFQAIQNSDGDVELTAFTSINAQTIDPPESCVQDWSAQPGIAVSTLTCWVSTGQGNEYGCGYRDVAVIHSYGTC